jgi:chromosome segregation ATPase
MNEFYKKIRAFLTNGRNSESVHYKNIKDGRTLTIDGKTFVRVKLKFVDTLDYNTSKTIDNLETETKLLNKKIEELTENLSSAEKQISLLRTLNTNLVNGERTELARLKSEILKLKTPCDSLPPTIKELETKIENQAHHITGLDKVNTTLKQKIKEQSDELNKLEQKNTQLTVLQSTRELA